MNEPQHCIKCEQIPQNIFALSCDHPLCLPCASKLTNQVGNIYEIICLECQQQTTFQQSLYAQLIHLLSSNIKQKKCLIQQKQKTSSIVHEHAVHPESQNFHPQVIDRYCSEHNDHDLAYVCKTCKNVLICPECIINGAHKHHQVATVQHQGKHIKTTIEHKISSLRHKIADLKTVQSTRLTNLQQRIHQIEELRFNIKQQYDQIKQKIHQEENSILGRCNELFDIHIQQEKNFKVQMQKQINNCEKMRNQFTQMLNPFMLQNEMMSSRTHYKIQTLNLIVNYYSKQLEGRQKSLLASQYSKKDNLVTNQVQDLINQLRMNKLPRYTVKMPNDFIELGLNVRTQNIPTLSKNEGLKEFNKVSKGNETKIPLEYFQLV